eukprot:scaffold6218_cov119-Isochrysis_galbana.AAC.3
MAGLAVAAAIGAGESRRAAFRSAEARGPAAEQQPRQTQLSASARAGCGVRGQSRLKCSMRRIGQQRLGELCLGGAVCQVGGGRPTDGRFDASLGLQPHPPQPYRLPGHQPPKRGSVELTKQPEDRIGQPPHRHAGGEEGAAAVGLELGEPKGLAGDRGGGERSRAGGRRRVRTGGAAGRDAPE